MVSSTHIVFEFEPLSLQRRLSVDERLDTRFFMIKSWTPDNVYMAYEEVSDLVFAISFLSLCLPFVDLRLGATSCSCMYQTQSGEFATLCSKLLMLLSKSRTFHDRPILFPVNSLHL